MPTGRSTRASILIFLLGLTTVMVVVAFGLLRSLQWTEGANISVRKSELARHAAEMGIQHGLAVCLHGFAMTEEVRENVTQPSVSHLDGLHRRVFSMLSPRLSAGGQAPTGYDIAPDVPFADMFNAYTGGGYHQSTTRINGFWPGYMTDRTYARYFEANRYDYRRTTSYDVASYQNAYNPVTFMPYTAGAPNPTPGSVVTPFPMVDPFETSGTITQAHALDNPVWYDASFRPVRSLSQARYRLRYAVSATDMSGNLWMNTDMPWLSTSRKGAARLNHKDAAEAIGARLGAAIGLENVFLGHGALHNSQFNRDGSPEGPGVPCDWPERGGAAMAPRNPGLGGEAYLFNLHGSPFSDWNDPVVAVGVRRWLGQPLLSWNDLAFAIEPWNVSMLRAGEFYSNENHARGNQFAQYMGTPFGKPMDGTTDNPWCVNMLTVSARVLQAMVASYVPPALRGAEVTSEAHMPFYSYVNSSGKTVSGYANNDGSYGAYTWKVSYWTLPAGARPMVPGPGNDLFNQGYLTALGMKPFDYPVIANQDYWYSAYAARPNPTKNQPLDVRTAAQRYPGTDFFSNPATEPTAQQTMVWLDSTVSPRQLQADPGNTTYRAPPLGSDHNGRHIVFHVVNSKATGGYDADVGTYQNFLSAYSGANMNTRFYPTSPYGVSGSGAGGDSRVSIYSGVGTYTVYQPAVPVPVVTGETYPALPGVAPDNVIAANTAPAARSGLAYPDFPALDPDKWMVTRGGSWGADSPTILPNSYWNRLAAAFFHAVFVAQIANMSWAEPGDARNQTGFTNGRNTPISYSSNPGWSSNSIWDKDMGTTSKRKGTASGSWDPKSTDFASNEQIDRQFLANLGESFDAPGTRTPDQVVGERPARFTFFHDWGSDPNPTSYGYGGMPMVGEYRITNNIRTLLTPVAGNNLTPRSTDAQSGAAAPPKKLWLLDEWNAAADAGYVPGTTVDTQPTRLARARAKEMERVLNDWRLSFLGSTASYNGTFAAKDFDGDGKVFCSGYSGAAADADSGLTCWETADAVGNGPGVASTKLQNFCLTGCLSIMRSRQFKIQSRGELFDNQLNRIVSQAYLESALYLDPDQDVTRPAAGLPTGLKDTTVLMQRPIHDYVRSQQIRSNN